MNLMLRSDLVIPLSSKVADLIRTDKTYDEIPLDIHYKLRAIIASVYLHQAKKTASREVYADGLNYLSIRKEKEDHCLLRGEAWFLAEQFSGHVISSFTAKLLLPNYIAKNKAALTISLTPIGRNGSDKPEAVKSKPIVSEQPIKAEIRPPKSTS